MKVLAIDTATERCSVALRIADRTLVRAVETARGHGDAVLQMIEEVLCEGGVALRELDGIAYGRGPGAFTGIRIAVGVVQGLAYGANVPTVGVSNLAAVAQQVSKAAARILVCTDARMAEVYWGAFEVGPGALVEALGDERVGRPEHVTAERMTLLAGTGFKVYPALRARYENLACYDDALPHAREIALLGAAALHAGGGEPAAQARPMYLRDQVTFVKSM